MLRQVLWPTGLGAEGSVKGLKFRVGNLTWFAVLELDGGPVNALFFRQFPKNGVEVPQMFCDGCFGVPSFFEFIDEGFPANRKSSWNGIVEDFDDKFYGGIVLLERTPTPVFETLWHVHFPIKIGKCLYEF